MLHNKIIKTNIIRTVISCFRNVLVLSSLSMAMYGYSKIFKNDSSKNYIKIISFFLFFIAIILALYNINFINRNKKILTHDTNIDYNMHLFLNYIYIVFIVLILYFNWSNLSFLKLFK